MNDIVVCKGNGEKVIEIKNLGDDNIDQINLSLSQLSQGIYYIKIGGDIFKIVKR